MMNRKTVFSIVLVCIAALTLIAMAPAGVAAQDSGNDTNGSDTLPNSTPSGAISADLYVTQESYAEGSVGVDDSRSLTLYRVSGQRAYITPINFSTDRVIDYGIREQAGSLTFDDRADEYVFAPNASGTFHLYWTVEWTTEREVQEGNETVTEEVTHQVDYEAVFQTENTNVVTANPEELEQTRRDAENWTELVSTIQSDRVAGSNADPQSELQSAVNYLRIIHNPVEALTGQAGGLILALFITLSGLLILSLFGFYHIASTWYEKRYIHRTESLEAEREGIEDRFDQLTRQERKRAIANRDWNDLFESDHIAAAFRRAFGETEYDGWTALEEILLPETMVHDRLQAMAYSGYDVEIKKEDGDIVDARILGAEVQASGDDDWEVVALQEFVDESPEDEEGSDEPTMKDLVEVIDWKDPEMVSFDMTDADFDRDQLGTVLDSPNIERLQKKVDEQLGPEGDFSSKKEYLKYISEFVEDVEQHEYTDHDGEPRPIRKMLNAFLKVSQVASDRRGFPEAKYISENIEMVLVDQNVGAEVNSYVQDVADGKHG